MLKLLIHNCVNIFGAFRFVSYFNENVFTHVRKLHAVVACEEQAVRCVWLLAERDSPDLGEPALDRQHDVLLCALAQ